MRALQRTGDIALADFLDLRSLCGHRPVFTLKIVGRLDRPDAEHLVDRFEEHFVAVEIEIAEQFCVGQKSASDCPQSLSKGWIGMVKKPRFIAHFPVPCGLPED